MKFYIVGGDVAHHPYAERVLSNHNYNPLTLWRQVQADVDQNGYRNIGITGGPLGGSYIWMRPFAAKQYTVRYIDAVVRADLEDPAFVPDCIIATVGSDTVPDAITYHETRYEMRFAPCGTYFPLESSSDCFAYYVKSQGQ